MSDLSTSATADQAAPGSAAPEPRGLDWRLALARRLATEAGDQPPHHDDPWVEDAAKLIYAVSKRESTWQPTVRHCLIHAALNVQSGDPLVRAVLEARLLSQQTPEEIEQRCHFTARLITAYRSMLFDVTDQSRVGDWLVSPSVHEAIRGGKLFLLGEVLKSNVLFFGAEGLERLVATLCRLGGPTLADGLPGRDTPDFMDELMSRLMLTHVLLPPNRRALHTQTDHYLQSLTPWDSGVPVSDSTVDEVVELFEKVRISQARLKQLNKLRASCNDVPAPSDPGHAAPPNDPAAVSV